MLDIIPLAAESAEEVSIAIQTRLVRDLAEMLGCELVFV